MDFTFFNQLILILALSVIMVGCFKRFNIPESLGYLFVGLLIGPTTSGILPADFNISLLAEIGVVFLLFTLGLEFSLKTISSMKKEVFGLGGMQVLLSSIGIFGVLLVCKLPIRESLIIAGALALSSTAIVSKELTQRNEIRARQGQLAIGVLLFQDIAAVFFLILIPTLAGNQEKTVIISLSLTLLKGVIFVIAMLAAGKWILPKVFHEIAQAKSEELFVLTALMTALMAAWTAHSLGLSMALGGFVAGMMMGESTYKHQIDADIRPFRDVLLGLFFVSVGLMLDAHLFRSYWYLIIGATTVLIALKFLIIFVLARTMGEKKKISFKTALSLSQGGEFCFALIALASQYGQIQNNVASFVLAVTILSMIIAPILIRNSRKLSSLLLDRSTHIKNENAVENEELHNKTAHIQHHTLICGYGRVGQTISRFLAQENKPFIIIDDDPLHVQEAGQAGDPVFYGDCRRIELLEAVGLNRAEQIIICIDDAEAALYIVKAIRKRILSVPILVRTRHFYEAELLKKAGATVVIPEVLESSLLIVKHTMLMMGFAPDLVRKRIKHAREHRYEILNGYYPGFQDYLKSFNAEPEYRHALTIGLGSQLKGKKISEINCKEASAVIVEARRKGHQIALIEDPILKVNDIVIFSGSKQAIAKIDQWYI